MRLLVAVNLGRCMDGAGLGGDRGNTVKLHTDDRFFFNFPDRSKTVRSRYAIDIFNPPETSSKEGGRVLWTEAARDAGLEK